MSLTSELRSSDSTVSNFFSKHFPYTEDLVRELNDDIETRQIIIEPRVPINDSGLIGTAFDYRARFYFTGYDTHKTLAFEGAKDFLHWGHERALIYELFSTFENDTWRIRPENRRLTRAQEDQINTNCLILAYFEQQFRTRWTPDYSGINKATWLILVAGKNARSAESLKTIVRRSYSAHLIEMKMLSYQFFNDMRRSLKKPVVLNPIFDGSRDVGGADADIIIGKALYELKTSRPRRPFSRKLFWQLLGYTLLDYSDEYKINRIGCYFPRHGYHRVWRLSEIMYRLSRKRRSLNSWRSKFARIHSIRSIWNRA